MKFCRLGLLQDALRMSLKKAARRAQTLGVSSRVFSPLQAIATAGAVMGGGSGTPSARIVLESDGAENVPMNSDDPQGAFRSTGPGPVPGDDQHR